MFTSEETPAASMKEQLIRIHIHTQHQPTIERFKRDMRPAGYELVTGALVSAVSTCVIGFKRKERAA